MGCKELIDFYFHFRGKARSLLSGQPVYQLFLHLPSLQCQLPH